MAQLHVPVRLKIRGSNKYTALFILYIFTFNNFTIKELAGSVLLI